MLRRRLENAHIDQNHSPLSGAPANVPPLFTAAEVDMLVNWVETKLG